MPSRSVFILSLKAGLQPLLAVFKKAGCSSEAKRRWRCCMRLIKTGMPVAIACLWSMPGLSTEHYDLVIAGGHIVDGTGGAPFEGAVAIRDQRIVALGHLPPYQAGEVVDARGLYVAPGFIDLHSHADYAMYSNPLMPNLLQQGITSILAGNCGSSPENIADALEFVESTGTGANTGFLIGHNTVRRRVLGDQGVVADSEAVAAMAHHVDQAMDQGAFGLSTGLKYVPGVYASTSEVVALAEVTAQHQGFYASHLRDEGANLMPAMEEALSIGELAALPVHISHHKAIGTVAWGASEYSLALIDSARERGMDVTADQYPYTASSTSFEILFPAWALAGGQAKLLERLADPAQRAQIKADLIHAIKTDRGGGDPSRIQVAHFKPDPTLDGQTFKQILEQRGLPTTLAQSAELAIELQGAGGGQAIYHAIDEQDVRRIMQHPQVAIATDTGTLHFGRGHPHPRGYGTFPRVLGHYQRSEGLLSLTEAIRKMTSLPAARMGLVDRGVLRTGYAADVVIFDADTISDEATFEQPHRHATGIAYVIVNGAIAYNPRGLTGVRAGQALRHTPVADGQPYATDDHID